MIIKIFSLFIILASLSACSMFGDKENKKDEEVFEKKRFEPNVKAATRKETDEGGLVLFGNKKSSELGQNTVLWKATLEALDFIPLTNASYGGGIIVTDWYKPNDNLNSSIKITVKFLSPELNIASIDVDAFEKTCVKEDCKTKKMSEEFSQKIKLNIMEKARDLNLKKKN